MTDYLWIIFEVNVLITLLFGIFKLIQRYLSFGWQRFSLLSIPVLSLAAVWTKHGAVSQSSWSYHIPVFELETIEIRPQQPVATPFDYSSLLEITYWLGVGFLSLWMLFNLYQVIRLFLKTNRSKEDGFTLIELPNEAPSSFFRFIQLPSGLSEYDRTIIFQHEKVHAQKLHSADRLYLEAIHCLSWFNPVLLLLKKELIHIHEFEVDRIMYNKYRVGYMEFLLAYSLGTSSSTYLFTNQFMTKLTLIKRIKIMKKNSKKVLIAALALPIIAGGMTLISFTGTNDKTPENSSTKSGSGSQETPTNKNPEHSKGTVAVPEKGISNANPEVLSDRTDKSTLPKEKDIYFAMPMGTTDEAPVVDEMPEISTKMRTLDTKSVSQEAEVDKMPEYPGGSEGLTKYLVNNIRYPEAAATAKTTGKVFVSFIVTKDGKVSKAAIKRGVSKELDNEALRVISAMPNWIPGEKEGKKIDAEMVLPVSFKL
ncbi:TonB family protein [Fluviicola sp.]|uniref:TonB family protein n=1 Tax=Fluviicola sp. TaxID=1917219 RepID=UPI003D2C28FC